MEYMVKQINMKLPINNRIIAQATLPNFELLIKENKMSKSEMEKIIKGRLATGFADEFINNISMEKIGGVGNEFEVKYVLEAYVFTRDQLHTFVQEIKDAFTQETKQMMQDLLDEKYGEGYNEGLYDGENK